jgi:hypothetical protein
MQISFTQWVMVQPGALPLISLINLRDPAAHL